MGTTFPDSCMKLVFDARDSPPCDESHRHLTHENRAVEDHRRVSSGAGDSVGFLRRLNQMPVRCEAGTAAQTAAKKLRCLGQVDRLR